jgi:hypothetical protein
MAAAAAAVIAAEKISFMVPPLFERFSWQALQFTRPPQLYRLGLNGALVVARGRGFGD